MTTPDTLAAQFDPDADETLTVESLTPDDVDSVISLHGVEGTLTSVTRCEDGTVHLLIQEEGRPFEASARVAADTPYVLIQAVATQVADVVSMEDFYGMGREMDRIGKRLTALTAEEDELKARKRELSDQMVAVFARLGESRLYFDDRRAYVFSEAYPKFKAKDDGTKYTLRDLVPLLRAMGREAQVQEPTVHFKTAIAVLKELTAEGGLPDELAAVVELEYAPSVRVGVGAKSKR